MLTELIKIIIPVKIKIKPSPEAMILLPVAVFFDLIGLLLACIGLNDGGIMEVVGSLIFGSWILGTKMTKKTNNVFRRALIRLGGETLLELIPYFDAIFFGYTFLVLGTLTDTNQAIQTEAEETKETEEAEKVASIKLKNATK